MEDGPPMFRQDNTCPVLLFALNSTRLFVYGAITHYGGPFQTVLL